MQLIQLWLFLIYLEEGLENISAKWNIQVWLQYSKIASKTVLASQEKRTEMCGLQS